MRIAAFFAIALAAWAQRIAPDELRVKSQTYVAPGASALRVDANLVEIGVVVRDSRGHPVEGLTKENFRLQDEGKDREIEKFAVDTVAGVVRAPNEGATARSKEPAVAPAAPATAARVRERYVALFFDDINAKDGPDAGDLRQTQDAAEQFLKDALKPGVEIGVFTTSGSPRLDFTTDEAKLIQAVKSVEPHVRLSESTCITPFIAYMMVVRNDSSALTLPQNANIDVNTKECGLAGRGAFQPYNSDQGGGLAQVVWKQTVDLSRQTLESIGEVADHLGTKEGSRVLLLASSGFITATLENERDRLIERALHAGVVINALDSKGLFEYLPPHTREYRLVGSKQVMIEGLERNRAETISNSRRVAVLNETASLLAQGTGGEFYQNNNDLHAGFEQLAAPPEVAYRLSFQPHDIRADGSYHKLKVTLENVKAATVQARPGYFAPQEQGLAKFDREVMGSEALEEIPVTLEAQNGKLTRGVIPVTVFVKLDVVQMGLTVQQGRKTGKVRIVSALKDANGAIVAAKEATMDLALKDRTYTRLTMNGLTAKLTLEAPPGSYQLREVVEDGGGKMSCSTNPIEVR